ncbi:MULTISPECIES: DEAD/DEAH box helicase [Hydrocarboniphaga]|uniref:ATP-dependent RNA helicase RhlB n=1 Tax=Hydrocarboniphaga effusa AP103 TaxID=1172194 RepID=I8HZW1_9GAMM|nr:MULTISPECIES: DEAD/DEAH box helicase [Hydrocarboniphaga]EIT69201.1 DEAD/DEAH box helicase domain-containing protein [Hydrocarboniphaga effusa AP103]MDZ4078047.1 DEAD/DEAH box helicase [Hydrocarboniphaga sp.]
MQPNHLSDTSFASLNLHPLLLSSLAKLGFDYCTPIQAQTLPLALAGADIAGQAQTGTGKSAAFLLATMQRLLTQPRVGPEGQPRAFILAPTRELAVQIHTDAVGLGADTGLKLAVCYGGTGYESQRQAIADGVDILIGTPGRLIDYYKQDVYTLKYIEVVVLDEADRMFDLGFIADIRYLFRRMPAPAQRKNYLFSATLSHRVLELAYEHMNTPTKVEVEPEQVTAERVRQVLMHVANDDKLPLLVGLLRHHAPVRSLVFVNTKRGAEEVENTLKANGFEASTLSGDVPQNKRLRLLEEFKEGKLPILVATDVAARGLHIPAVTHVINYDLPQDAEDYVHRIGRTARAGQSGDAISLCCETYVYSLPEIEKYIGNRIPVEQPPEEWMPKDFVRVKRSSSSYGGGRRPGSGGPRRSGGGGRRR